MARYPAARWVGPVPNETPGAMLDHYGLVLHVEQGTEQGTDTVFHRPGYNASAHFGVAKSGQVDQWVDTADKAWAEAAGNRYWLSVETEGYATEALTTAQVEALAHLYAWCHQTHGIPLQLTDDVSGRGFGWHGMGGTAWGNHPGCPGDLRKGQRQAILDRASQLLASGGISVGNPYEVDMQITDVVITIPCGPDGKGWTPAPVPYATDKIVGYLAPGLRPYAGDAVITGEVGFAEDGAGTAITVTGWAPNQSCVVRLRVAQ